jgi:hypothetical protein
LPASPPRRLARVCLFAVGWLGGPLSLSLPVSSMMREDLVTTTTISTYYRIHVRSTCLQKRRSHGTADMSRPAGRIDYRHVRRPALDCCQAFSDNHHRHQGPVSDMHVSQSLSLSLSLYLRVSYSHIPWPMPTRYSFESSHLVARGGVALMTRSVPCPAQLTMGGQLEGQSQTGATIHRFRCQFRSTSTAAASKTN